MACEATSGDSARYNQSTNAPYVNAQHVNARYLALEMDRLRLLIRRRVLWLRRRWRADGAPGHVSWAITDQEAEVLLEGEDRQEESHFYHSDESAVQITDALDELDLQLHAHRREMEAAGVPGPARVVANRFSLTAFEHDVLLLCLAPELDPAFERLYAYVQDDATRRFATPHLALMLLGTSLMLLGSSGVERASFFPGAALIRWRLVTVEADGSNANGFLSSALRIDQRVMNFLLDGSSGDPDKQLTQLDRRCRGVLSPAPVLPLSHQHHEQAAILAQWLGRGIAAGRQHSKHSKRINLVGQTDSGRSAISQAICEQAGINLLTVDPGLLPTSTSERRELTGLIEREAVLTGSAIFLNLDLLNQEESRTVLSAMTALAVPLIIASQERVSCEQELLTALVARPDAASQAAIWKHVLGPAFALPGRLEHDRIEHDEIESGQIETLVQQFDLGPSGIVRAAALARNQAVLRAPDERRVNASDLWEACRRQTAPRMGLLAHKISLCYGWNDIVVPSEVLSQLHEMTAQVAHRHHVYQHWGFGRKLNRGRGIGALFSGASGVGKTMAAEVIAAQLNLDLYRIDLAGVMSKYIGEAEKNLCSIFDAAERSGAILFFDEADALFGKRSEVKDSHDRYANIEINYLLQRMEDYRGLAILATNMKASLDTAFIRRLRFIVDFPVPDTAQRVELWRKVFPPTAAIKDLDYRALSKFEITGGNIRNIAVNAAFLAAAQGGAIGMEHVMRAAKREYAKMGRLVMDAEFGRYSGTSVQ